MFLITNILLYVLLLYECSGYISNQFFSYNSYTIISRNSRNSNKNNKIYSDFFILPHSSYSYSIRGNLNDFLRSLLPFLGFTPSVSNLICKLSGSHAFIVITKF